MIDASDRHAPSRAELATVATEAGELEALHDVFSTGDVEAFTSVIAATSEAKCFITKSAEAQLQCRTALQSAYRVALQGLRQDATHTVGAAVQAPAKLVTQNFHVEQIWAQIDMLNSVGMTRVRKLMKHMSEDVHLLDASMEEAVDELLAGVAPDSADRSSGDSSAHAEDSIRDDASGEDAEIDTGVDKEIDFDAMLAADQRKHKHAKAPASGANGEEGHKPDSSDGGQIEEHGGSDDGDESDGADESGGNEESGGDDAGEGDEEELLPTEDDFLRLEDMEKFVQHGEAAEAAGDLGGFDGFGDFLEGREIGGADGEADEEQEEVDLYGGWEDGGSSGADSDDGDGMLDGSAIKYEDFFGRSMPYKRAGGPQAARKAGAHGRRHDTSASVATEAAEQREEASAEPAAEREQSDDEAAALLSTHERRQRKIAAQIAQIEEAAMQEKSWHLRGEATAAMRPKDSALEIDVDFERTTRPPPEPTFEAAVALEDIIKARILELRFDNVVRVVPAGPKKERRSIALDDAKAKQGLADEYEADLKRAVTGTSEDRNAGTRKEIKDLFAQLSAKLDALSHLGLAAKPVITEMEVKVDAPAIAMEEAAPVTMSTASMKVPEEAHAQKRKQRQFKADDEQSQADRRQARASHKRIGKRKRQEKEEAAGIYAHEKGIKSAREDAAAEREARMASKKPQGNKKADKQAGPTTAAAVFKQLQEERHGVKAANKNVKGSGLRSTALMM